MPKTKAAHGNVARPKTPTRTDKAKTKDGHKILCTECRAGTCKIHKPRVALDYERPGQPSIVAGPRKEPKRVYSTTGLARGYSDFKPGTLPVVRTDCKATFHQFTGDCCDHSAICKCHSISAQRERAPESASLSAYLRMVGLDICPDPEMEKELEGMLIDSECGRSCRGAIDAGRALLTHVEAATGQDYPERNEMVLKVIRHVLSTYIFG